MKLRPLILAALVAGHSAGAVPERNTPSNTMPLTMVDQFSGHAAWVDQSIALSASGQFNSDVFNQAEVATITDLLKGHPVDGCIRTEYSQSDFASAPPRDTLEEASRSADVIVRGRITGRSFGFFAGTPGQLLRISITTVFKGDAPLQEYYSFFPEGRVKIGNQELCQQARPFSVPPHLGEEILLFSLQPWNYGPYPFITINDPGDVVVVHGNGTLSLPEKYVTRTEGDMSVRAPLKARPDTIGEIEAIIASAIARPRGDK